MVPVDAAAASMIRVYAQKTKVIIHAEMFFPCLMRCAGGVSVCLFADSLRTQVEGP